MPSSRSLIVAALGATLAWSSSAAATGAVKGGVRWKTGSVTLALDPSLDAIPKASKVVQLAGETWKASGASSPGLSTTRRAADAIGYVPGGKNQSTVRFAKKGEPLAKGAVAITVLTYEAKTGTILDADVVLNGVYRFGDADTESSKAKHKPVYDVQSVLTHELGHLQGLGDDRDHAHAAMYAWTSPGETHKRELAAEDEAALLSLYPLELALPEREPDAGGAAACASVPGAAGGGFASVAVLAGLAAIALRRRAGGAGAAALVALSALAAPVSAAPVVEHALVDGFSVNAVAIATVASATSRFEGGLIVTELELADVSCAGVCDQLDQRVRVVGGRVGEIAQVVSHAPVPQLGARVRIEVSASEDGLGRHRIAEWVTTNRSEP